MTEISKRDRILGGLWGALVGDALGVPVGFKSRDAIRSDPVQGMRGFGTHAQRPGTWSDDGALTLCTVESLIEREFDPQHMGDLFVDWMENGRWSARGEVFDIGLATTQALRRIRSGTPALQAGGASGHSNGNGSLMRILPVALRFAEQPTGTLLERVFDASKITHAHPRSQLACGLYSLVVRELLKGSSPHESFASAKVEFMSRYQDEPELRFFETLLEKNLAAEPEHNIASGGYVMETLRASLWCLITTNNFQECVLRGVNLGYDTDTTGCVAGGLAGVCYGFEAIPEPWLAVMARQIEIHALLNRFTQLIGGGIQ